MRHILSVFAGLLSVCVHSQESFTFEHNGLTRNYLLTIPETIDAQIPLVFLIFVSIVGETGCCGKLFHFNFL